MSCDMKPRGLKAPMHLLPRAALVWAARVMGYGASKYKRGNYLLPVEGERPLEKAQEYCGAALRHLTAHTHHSEAFLATAPPADMQEVSGIAWDESKLPHLAHALVSIMMAIQALVDGGLIEEDPNA